jgi:hypothetical protein
MILWAYVTPVLRTGAKRSSGGFTMRLIKGLCAGAILGVLLAAPDGALIGWIVAAVTSAPERGPIIGWWALTFALAGGLIGATVGGVLGACANRLTLPPPE